MIDNNKDYIVEFKRVTEVDMLEEVKKLFLEYAQHRPRFSRF